MFNYCCLKHYSSSEDLIPTSATGQKSISNYVEMDELIDRDAIMDHHSPPPNLTFPCTNAGLFVVPHFLQRNKRLLSG
ncbi:hypothetical protein TNCT_265971 [Trichonephila clavata]|uniref:Uncharacterized protein n=1 Tax=Trichonephila clavata TaxID=2740835 RepID=A0A8X6KAS8_TRICU|nr:hypothetical protein TNCT_265971 [Trichonephila clavata]